MTQARPAGVIGDERRTGRHGPRASRRDAKHLVIVESPASPDDRRLSGSDLPFWLLRPRRDLPRTPGRARSGSMLTTVRARYVVAEDRRRSRGDREGRKWPTQSYLAPTSIARARPCLARDRGGTSRAQDAPRHVLRDTERAIKRCSRTPGATIQPQTTRSSAADRRRVALTLSPLLSRKVRGGLSAVRAVRGRPTRGRRRPTMPRRAGVLTLRALRADGEGRGVRGER